MSPVSCAIQRTDMFSFDNQSEGLVNVTGGQHKATMRFYGWAAHEQMPLRSLVIDWGDGSRQELPDAKLKNHKPMCTTQSECSDPIKGAGITCNTDSDCPPGAGKCAPLGTCGRRQNISCHTDADCTSGKNKDICLIRTFFGNSTEACEANYFEFNHLYTCAGKRDLQTCEYERSFGQRNFIEGRCSRDSSRGCTTPADEARGLVRLECAPGDTCIPTGLAPPQGCWDEKTNSCRFTPRILLQDNWGWCTGECRSELKSGSLQDTAPPANNALHTYGGCYSWSTQGAEIPNIRSNNENLRIFPKLENECKQENPNIYDGIKGNFRPWIVYPGSLQLRSSGELGGEQSEESNIQLPPPAPVPIDCKQYKDRYFCPVGCALDKTDPKNWVCKGDERCNDHLPLCPPGCQFAPGDNACVSRV